MTDQPMIEAERALIAHPWAVRVNLPTDLKHAAQLARRALDVAAYARLDAPQAVARAVEVLGGVGGRRRPARQGRGRRAGALGPGRGELPAPPGA